LARKPDIALATSSSVPCCTKAVSHRSLHRFERKIVCAADSKGSEEKMRKRISSGKLLIKSSILASVRRILFKNKKIKIRLVSVHFNQTALTIVAQTT
jgi:hypothetical protein